MNDAQAAPGASLLPDSTGLITGVHFVLIAIFAVAAVAIILVGIRRKRRRTRAEKVVVERIEQAERDEAAPAAPAAPPPAPAPPRPTPPDDAAITEAAPPAPPAPAPAAGDDPAAQPLTLLKGLGPKVAARLGELGIATVGQLAALSDDEVMALDAQLGPFTGRMTRDRWPEQARLLAAGDRAGFEAAFGKL